VSVATDQAVGLRELMREKKPQSKLRVIGVCSGKGGVGKSNISSNLAVLCAKSGKRVLVLDADLGLANIEVLYGIKPRYHLGHLLDAMPMNEVLATGPHGVRILSAGNGIQQLTQLDDAQKLKLVTALDSIEELFDVVIVDTGAGIGDNVLFFVGAAQEALLVVNPEPTSLTDAYATVKVLATQARVKFFNVVVNSAPDEARARDIFSRLSTVASRFLDAQLKYLGWVPRDENMHRAVMTQQPICEAFPSSPAARAINLVADNLFNEPPPPNLDGGFKFLWNRLLRETDANAPAAAAGP
jgi:flagellar biosynthesis protein FlhG